MPHRRPRRVSTIAATALLLGTLLPATIVFGSRFNSTGWLITAAALIIAGGTAQLYVTIIGGQSIPLDLFPGMTESSSFFDGVVSRYTPSVWEWALGCGGVALTVIGIIVGMRVLPIFPASSQSR